ncbi:NUDIX domain-containing protein [Nocardia sp. NRRL S-836]|uniref:NUDIX domain-containing protein n=1 Tax=Nocardia sp. NRRL S-836 TaxID=1519492 RepID=UPI0006AF69BC|nr:NUDIX domain-containing protein [Nocardia sp. NRRL S-836]KOV84697.1 NUDIX hydrolase [Nocardia sp. NRRL S-836]
MPVQGPIARRSARAVLFDKNRHLVLIKRNNPGQPPYWTTPGGGIKDGDASAANALERELVEELGAVASVGGRGLLISSETEQGLSVQEIFVARLMSIDETARNGAEWTDSSRGGYEVVRVPIDQVYAIDLRPREVKEFVTRNALALLAEVLG